MKRLGLFTGVLFIKLLAMLSVEIRTPTLVCSNEKLAAITLAHSEKRKQFKDVDVVLTKKGICGCQKC